MSKIAAVFPGQGSQHVGMVKEFFENFQIAREVFEEASDAIRIDLKKLCFEGPESDLTLTQNTQPCLLTASVAVLRVVEKELPFRPHAVAGHSLGEYSALVAAHSIELTQAVRWVRERGQAMQTAVPAGEGSMAAILGLEDSQVEFLCKKATEAAIALRAQSDTPTAVAAIVEPANFNSPGQVVIAGSVDAVTEATRIAKSDSDFKGAKAIPLAVSAPFHCQLMSPARDRMAEIFQSTPIHQQPTSLRYPYVPNRTARLTQEPRLVFELLIEQIDHPVLWKQSVQHLASQDFSTFIEFGPGKVLSGLIKRITSQSSGSFQLASVNDLASLKLLEKQLEKPLANPESPA